MRKCDCVTCFFGLLSFRESSFFVHAEDGIRDYNVTGVQTCALPIFRQAPTQRRAAPDRRAPVRSGSAREAARRAARTSSGAEAPGPPGRDSADAAHQGNATPWVRSEERRVGKEGGARWAAGQARTTQ